MTNIELWTKLVETQKCEVVGSKLYPDRELKIGGKVVDHLEKNGDDVRIILKHTIHHPGENIGYGIYGTPKHLWAA